MLFLTFIFLGKKKSVNNKAFFEKKVELLKLIKLLKDVEKFCLKICLIFFQSVLLRIKLKINWDMKLWKF